MKKVFITGALGQLGQALVELMKNKPEYQLYLTDSSPSEDGIVRRLDITQEVAVESEIASFFPDIIINCAAMTAVDLCESEQEKAYNINALGPKYIAKIADRIGAKLIHISTDYVYDGQAQTPYTEEQPVNPVSVYGRTKNEGDVFVRKYCAKSFILHTAWVYGEGKNFVKTMLRLADEGKKIRVVADQIGTPTSALELARLIIFLMETDSYGKYHATCEGSTTWYDFAHKIFELAGKRVELEPITTSEHPTPAKRPMYSVLDNKMLRQTHGYYMKDWEDAFKEYMDRMQIN
ncbi:MAG: dTDP-4-dehydrorhamnose reductase [Clostridiales bacterium]|jgi:dTDP-4-dehydrorhamnose reductase|nr:dTDP-4-dehydrorhamnose reductase [Bacillota bacterium]NLK02877.1 dTDP-4-dehydrorhamnose reductase [Clostridiales bacterium]